MFGNRYFVSCVNLTGDSPGGINDRYSEAVVEADDPLSAIVHAYAVCCGIEIGEAVAHQADWDITEVVSDVTHTMNVPLNVFLVEEHCQGGSRWLNIVRRPGQDETAFHYEPGRERT